MNPDGTPKIVIPKFANTVGSYDDAVDNQALGYIGPHLRKLDKADTPPKIVTSANGGAFLRVTRLKQTISLQISRNVAEELAAMGVEVLL